MPHARHHRADVVDRAISVLDAHGLGDLSMRRLAAELDVQPSALYHHFASKQLLLAAVADELLSRGRAAPEAGEWDEQVVAVCTGLRDAMLAYRDGAEVVATVFAFGLGAREPHDRLVAALAVAGLGDDVCRLGATTLLHYVFGHATDEQMHRQADAVGAIDAPVTVDAQDTFALGLAIVLDGLRARVPV